MANVNFNDTHINMDVKNPGLYIHEESNTNPNPFIAQFNRGNLSSSYSNTTKYNTFGKMMNCMEIDWGGAKLVGGLNGLDKFNGSTPLTITTSDELIELLYYIKYKLDQRS